MPRQCAKSSSAAALRLLGSVASQRSTASALPRRRNRSTERRQFSEVISQQVVDGDPVLCPVTLHLFADREDRLVEVGVGIGQLELLFQEVVAHAGHLFLVGEGDQRRVPLLQSDAAIPYDAG